MIVQENNNYYCKCGKISFIYVKRWIDNPNPCKDCYKERVENERKSIYSMRGNVAG